MQKAISNAVSVVAADLDFTRREAVVLRHLMTGASNRQIAVKLNCTKKTIARHLTHMYRKASVFARAEMIMTVMESCLRKPRRGEVCKCCGHRRG